ncbi:hypothetical protein CEXT_515321 [Caerostris extrusa]|uniref:Uncharacterized protein n=1 Tax=Caerostris extrusa TaxID=172846 RepID=A0AAV4NVK4_CAEEX|nr:hypothetical protein CEXT_515321 [Caerostris extrusa]
MSRQSLSRDRKPRDKEGDWGIYASFPKWNSRPDIQICCTFMSFFRWTQADLWSDCHPNSLHHPASPLKEIKSNRTARANFNKQRKITDSSSVNVSSHFHPSYEGHKILLLCNQSLSRDRKPRDKEGEWGIYASCAQSGTGDPGIQICCTFMSFFRWAQADLWKY